jgi:hypothetical protein
MAIACCYEGCGASVCFTPELEQRLRSTHEFWMCPFGHEQHFTKETPKDAEIRFARNRAEMWRVRAEEAQETFAQCPFCDWHSGSGIERRWMSMLRHFAMVHEIDGPDGADLRWMAREGRLEAVS